MKNKKVKNKQRKLRLKKDEPLPAHLASKSKRSAHIKAVVSIDKEEKKLAVKELNKVSKTLPWNWTTNIEKAAYYIAENRLSPKQISDETGISVNRLKKWSTTSDIFVQRVEDYRTKILTHLTTHGMANKNTRVMALAEIGDALKDIIKQRKDKYQRRVHPGANTGYMIRTVKAVGHGRNVKIVRGWDIDKDLIRELRETLLQIAKERGELTEKVETANMVLIREYGGVATDKV